MFIMLVSAAAKPLEMEFLLYKRYKYAPLLCSKRMLSYSFGAGLKSVIETGMVMRQV